MDADIKVKVEDLWDSVRSSNSEPTTDELVTCSRCGFSYPLRELLMLSRTHCRNCGAELDLVKALPSAQPERKRGRWIKVNGTAINCSACHRCSWSLSFDDTVRRFNFCPNCGADMRGEQDG